jgi:uncharacterized protein (TIGR02391 family)
LSARSLSGALDGLALRRKMEINFKELLHSRIQRHCEKLFDGEHFKHAALEAMKQVELALKEKSGLKKPYGVNLVKNLFGEGEGIKLRVPFGNNMQKEAKSLFEGTFSYYRNYAAHDGSKIVGITCARIMIMASELLDLIGASSISFEDIGGLDGLVKNGIFPSKKSVVELLKLMDGKSMVDECYDGMFEQLTDCGFSETQLHSLMDIGLLEYFSEPYVTSELDKDDPYPPITIEWFEATKLGKEIVSSLHDAT